MNIQTLPGATWPELEPLMGAESPPPFPTEALPGWLARYIRAEAVATQIPEDMAGMLAFSALSTAVQGRINARANNDTWIEPVTLYTATVMDPGQRKSAIFERINAPLLDWEAVVQEREWPELSQSEQEYKEMEQTIDRADLAVQKARTAVSAARRGDSAPDTIRGLEADLQACRDEAVEARTIYNQMKPMAKTRLVFNDLTPEAAAIELARQRGERISVISDEGGVFEVLSGGRYSDRLNLDIFLKGHSGNLVVVDRVGRGGERVTRPMITLGLAIQPQVLQDVGKSKQMHGRGLLARFLYAVPESQLGERLIDAPSVTPEIATGYRENLVAICESAYEQSETVAVALSDEAQSVFWGLQQQLEPRLKPDVGDLDGIVEWSSKLAGAILRIAALIAVSRESQVAVRIEEDDMLAAIEFSEYLIAHAWRAFSMMGVVESVTHEHRVLRRLRSDGLTEFTSRDMYRLLNMHRYMAAEQFEELLTGLARMGYVRLIIDSTKPPRAHWSVNPAVHEEAPNV